MQTIEGMKNRKEGDQLPPLSIEFIVGNKKMKLTDDEKSRKFWLGVIGCLDTIMFFGVAFFINLIVRISLKFSTSIPSIAPWALLIVLVGLVIYINSCFMNELNRRFPRTRRDEL